MYHRSGCKARKKRNNLTFEYPLGYTVGAIKNAGIQPVVEYLKDRKEGPVEWDYWHSSPYLG
jgi:hypothetical protein